MLPPSTSLILPCRTPPLLHSLPCPASPALPHTLIFPSCASLPCTSLPFLSLHLSPRVNTMFRCLLISPNVPLTNLSLFFIYNSHRFLSALFFFFPHASHFLSFSFFSFYISFLFPCLLVHLQPFLYFRVRAFTFFFPLHLFPSILYSLSIPYKILKPFPCIHYFFSNLPPPPLSFFWGHGLTQDLSR